jgi:hypothetical protein
MTREWLEETFPDEEILLADGFDEAIIGVCDRTMRVCYSIRRAVEVLVGQGLEWDEAEEYLYFNTVGAWVGEKTPIWIHEASECL